MKCYRRCCYNGCFSYCNDPDYNNYDETDYKPDYPDYPDYYNPTDNCGVNPCSNGALCLADHPSYSFSYTCVCTRGWAGPFCRDRT